MIGASYDETDGSVESGTSKNVELHIKFAGNGPRYDIEVPVGELVCGLFCCCWQLLLSTRLFSAFARRGRDRGGLVA